MKSLSARLAKKEDAKLVHSILYETAEWLNKKGSSQWEDILNGKANHDVSTAITLEQVYIAELNGVIIGTFVLWDKQSTWDIELWGEESTKNHYYLHRLALAEDVHGEGLGKDLVDMAILIAKKDGKKSVRLDCLASTKYLNDFYQKCGFIYFRTINQKKPDNLSLDYNLYIKQI